MHNASLFLIVIGLVIPFHYVFAAPFDTPGLKNNFNVNVNGKKFQIETTANFEIVDTIFDQNENKIRFEISSGVKNNLAEILVPKTLSPEGFSFYLNGEDFSPTIKSNDQIYFVTLKFNGTGNHLFEAKLNEEQPSLPSVINDESSMNYLYLGTAIVIGAGISSTIIYKSKKRK